MTASLSCRLLFQRIPRSCFRNSLCQSTAHQRGNMSAANQSYSLFQVVKTFNKFASPSLAESWDNVGLLVEPPSPQEIKKVLLTNDLTEDVLEEALQLGVQLILSYHPPIFAPLKSVTSKSWKERIVGKLLENRIALYSPHTAWDTVQGGVNDWLASAFEKYSPSVQPLTQHCVSGSTSHILGALFSNDSSAWRAVQDIKSSSPSVPHCCVQSDGGVLVQVHCNASEVQHLLQHLSSSQNLSVVKNEKIPQANYGAGRKLTLKEPIQLSTAVDIVKQHLKMKDISLAIARCKDDSSMVSTIALCAGSGVSVLKGVKADLYLTGEMQHHDVLDAVHKGIHVILTRHSNSERGFLQVMASGFFRENLLGIDFIISQQDKDPLTTV